MILHDSQAVAEMLGRSAAWVESQARAGRIPARKIGRVWRFADADVDAYLEAARTSATTVNRPARRRRAS